MKYVSFYEYFPEIAMDETRCITSIGDPELPPGDYALMEFYCDDPRCDCRRVFLSVRKLDTNEFVAVIAYGWESEEFYAKWVGRNDPETIKGLKGPCLNLTSPQSELAPALLKKVEQWVLADERYVERLKRHYRMFKATIRKKRGRR